MTVSPFDRLLVEAAKSIESIEQRRNTLTRVAQEIVNHQKEFFDNEVGLFRAKRTKDIKKKIAEVTSPYGPVKGVRIVALAD